MIYFILAFIVKYLGLPNWLFIVCWVGFVAKLIGVFLEMGAINENKNRNRGRETESTKEECTERGE